MRGAAIVAARMVTGMMAVMVMPVAVMPVRPGMMVPIMTPVHVVRRRGYGGGYDEGGCEQRRGNIFQHMFNLSD